MAKIKVTAGEGRTTPIDRSIATAPGAQQLYLKPGAEVEVEAGHPSIVRQLRSGDLVRCLVPRTLAPGEVLAEGELADPPTRISAEEVRASAAAGTLKVEPIETPKKER